MFSFRLDQSVRVHSASAFKTKEGEDGYVLICTEDENQPEGLERPSRSKNQIKVWGKGAMPEGLHNNCIVQFKSIAGFDWKHLPRKNKNTGEYISDRYGNTIYDSHIELVGAVIHIVDPVEKAKGKKAKAEG